MSSHLLSSLNHLFKLIFFLYPFNFLLLRCLLNDDSGHESLLSKLKSNNLKRFILHVFIPTICYNLNVNCVFQSIISRSIPFADRPWHDTRSKIYFFPFKSAPKSLLPAVSDNPAFFKGPK